MEFEIIEVKPGEDLGEILPVREEILGTGEDDLDEIGISLMFKEEGVPVAVGRMVLDMEADRLIIEQIGVAQGRRRQGIGSEMLDRLMDIARDSEADEVWAKTKNNKEAIALLAKHGFDEMNFYWMCVDMPYYKR